MLNGTKDVIAEIAECEKIMENRSYLQMLKEIGNYLEVEQARVYRVLDDLSLKTVDCPEHGEGS